MVVNCIGGVPAICGGRVPAEEFLTGRGLARAVSTLEVLDSFLAEEGLITGWIIPGLPFSFFISEVEIHGSLDDSLDLLVVTLWFTLLDSQGSLNLSAKKSPSVLVSLEIGKISSLGAVDLTVESCRSATTSSSSASKDDSGPFEFSSDSKESNN